MVRAGAAASLLRSGHVGGPERVLSGPACALLVGILLLLPKLPLAAQEWGGATRTLAFYLDCCDPTYPDPNCDTDYFKREMAFVDWVRDRREADVAALVRTRATAGGGTEYTVCFLRGRASQVASDTLTFMLPANTSADAGRRALLTVLKAGVAPDLIGTVAEENLRVSVRTPPGGSAGGATSDDPWKAWVLGLDINGYIAGERSYRTRSVGDDFWARRVTERRKLGLMLTHTYNEQLYRLDYGDFLATNRSFSGSIKSVWSVSRHVSAGISGYAGTRTFDNYRFYEQIGPTLEYDLYPYDDSAGRLVTVAYSLLGGYNRYDAETLYGETREGILRHKATFAVNFRQPYGTAGVVTELAQYLHRADMWRASVSGSVTLNLVRGWSLAVNGSWSRINDQFNLPTGGVSDEQVIARLRQMATTYQYIVNVGFSYVFGSKVNNVVNPRLTQVYGDI